ncbi:hypothetical protein BD311DRAFT_744867 [Dichomitus squalens]|uniref:Uncharacterized protein n=1 Tax=Dichomitus squalens TaxID=114155 RepID=A0A4Q9N5N9_9APHY|nr:hypothetical protein BD311DRAFT_744867 [Dichomitus squalens]
MGVTAARRWKLTFRLHFGRYPGKSARPITADVLLGHRSRRSAPKLMLRCPSRLLGATPSMVCGYASQRMSRTGLLFEEVEVGCA